MKKFFLLSLYIFVGTSCIAQAGNYLAPKRVNLPFSNVPVLSQQHNGILFEYDMSGNPAKQVMCDYKNGYKATAIYRENNILKDTGFPHDGSSIFTSKGEDGVDQGAMVYHTDKVGGIKIKDYENHGKIGSLSCRYTLDDSPLANK